MLRRYEIWHLPKKELSGRPALPSAVQDAQVGAQPPRASTREFLDGIRRFGDKHEWHLTSGHTPGHSAVDLVSRSERLTFAGATMFPIQFDHPD